MNKNAVPHYERMERFRDAEEYFITTYKLKGRKSLESLWLR
jgi:hypothetical protein